MPPGQGRRDRRSRGADPDLEGALDLLNLLVRRLQRALELLRQVPQDLGEVYELVYAFIRKGGKLPMMARWIEGAGAGQ